MLQKKNLARCFTLAITTSEEGKKKTDKIHKKICTINTFMLKKVLKKC